MRWMLAIGAIGSLGLGLLVSSGPASADADPPTATARTVPVVRHGLYCAPASRSPVSAAVGFGAAVLATGWLARRRTLDPA